MIGKAKSAAVVLEAALLLVFVLAFLILTCGSPLKMHASYLDSKTGQAFRVAEEFVGYGVTDQYSSVAFKSVFVTSDGDVGLFLDAKHRNEMTEFWAVLMNTGEWRQGEAEWKRYASKSRTDMTREVSARWCAKYGGRSCGN